jgi:hypothetical protein
VAEELALQQPLGNGGAVQRQERRLGPGDVPVKGRATSYLRPLSQVMSTGTSLTVTRLIALYSSHMTGLEPAIAPSTSGPRVGLGHHGRLAHPPPSSASPTMRIQCCAGPLPFRL